MSFQVNVVLTLAGANTGPFNIFSNLNYSQAVASGIQKSDIISGVIVTVPDGATSVRVVNQGGVCDGRYVDITIGGYPTPTPTQTPTSTTPLQYYYSLVDYTTACNNGSILSTPVFDNSNDFCSANTISGGTIYTISTGTDFWVSLNGNYRKAHTRTPNLGVADFPDHGCGNCSAGITPTPTHTPTPTPINAFFGYILTQAPTIPADCDNGGTHAVKIDGNVPVWQYQTNVDVFGNGAIASDYGYFNSNTYTRLADFGLTSGTTYYVTCGACPKQIGGGNGQYASFVYHGGNSVTLSGAYDCPSFYEFHVYTGSTPTTVNHNKTIKNVAFDILTLQPALLPNNPLGFYDGNYYYNIADGTPFNGISGTYYACDNTTTVGTITSNGDPLGAGYFAAFSGGGV